MFGDSVAIDGEIVSNATGYKPGWHPNTLLYHASDLSSDSEHTVVRSLVSFWGRFPKRPKVS